MLYYLCRETTVIMQTYKKSDQGQLVAFLVRLYRSFAYHQAT